MIKIQRFVCNFIEENCYVISDSKGHAVIIDCGAFSPEEKERIGQYIEDEQIVPEQYLCTHSHFDHVWGAQFITDTYHLLPRMSHEEQDTYTVVPEQMRLFLHRDFPITLPAAGEAFSEGDTIQAGEIALKVILTPGHTPGGVCFYLESENILFSGDSLFRSSIGRCDLPGGDEHALITSLRQKVLTLPEKVTVLPGHGPATTIGEEKRHNSYLF